MEACVCALVLSVFIIWYSEYSSNHASGPSFFLGERPLESKGTVIRLAVSSEANGPLKNDDWRAVCKNHLKSSVEIHVISSADAIVGRYHIYVETVTQGSEGSDEKTLQSRKEFDDTLIMLFNAWCPGNAFCPFSLPLTLDFHYLLPWIFLSLPEDEVYMENDEEKQEYVMNEVGRIWQGTSRSYAPQSWNFGQVSLMQYSFSFDHIASHSVALSP